MIDICEVGTCVLWHDSGGETDTAEGEAGEVYATVEEGRSVGRVLWREGGSGSDGEGARKLARTNCMMPKGLSLDGVVVNRAIWIGAWVSQVPAGHGTCPVVQILTSPLSTGIFFK